MDTRTDARCEAVFGKGLGKERERDQGSISSEPHYTVDERVAASSYILSSVSENKQKQRETPTQATANIANLANIRVTTN